MPARLGQLLIASNIITEGQLKEALDLQRREGGKIGINLVKLGYVTEEKLVAFLSRPVSDEPDRDGREAREATRGSAIKLAAEALSRLLGLGTTLLLIRGLGAADFGAFGRLSVFALLLAELGELGLHTLGSRVLVAGPLSLAGVDPRARTLLHAMHVSAAIVIVRVLTLVPRRSA